MTYLYVLAAIVLRIAPHPWNLTPLAAMFLFSGATFRSKREALLVPLAALLVSDYAVIRVLWHSQYGWFSPATWAAFLLVGVIGFTLRNRITFRRVVVASLAGSVSFFLITNFAVWIGGTLYPKTFGGLAASYVAALPFFRNTVIGDLFYAGVMFGSYAWLQRRSLALARQH